MLTPEQKQRKDEKMVEMIRQGVAEFIERESNGKSLVTITRIVLSADKKKGTIFFTTLPDSYQDEVLHFIERSMHDLVQYLRKKDKIARLPLLHPEIDFGERNRQKIDTIIAKENNNQSSDNE